MITALTWQLRPFYIHPEWKQRSAKLEELILRGISLRIADVLIKRMLQTIDTKQKQNAPRYWLREDYSLKNPHWRTNIIAMACFFFPEEKDQFRSLEADNLDELRKIKNRVEREELRRSRCYIPDDFENDTRYAKLEEERWQASKRPYSEVIAGLDFLEPVPGIDY